MILLENIFEEQILRKLKPIIDLIEENTKEWGFIGGIPRDFFFYKKKLKTNEIDILFFQPIEKIFLILTEKLRELVKEKYFHNRFLTGKIVLKNGLVIDLITARSEYYANPGYLPIVRPTNNIIIDALRRDITINTILFKRFCKHPDLMLEIIDKLGGYKDLLNSTIRILHIHSLQDDPTRIYRILRYKTRFNFEIEKKTYTTILFSLKYVNSLSINRVFNELKKVNLEKKFDKIFEEFLLLNFDPIDLKQISLEEKEKYQQLIKDLKTLRKSIISFEKLFYNKKQKLKKDYDKNKVIFSFLLSKGFLNNPRYSKILSKEVYKFAEIWKLIFSITEKQNKKLRNTCKINAQELKKIYLNFENVEEEIFIPLIFLLYKTNSLHLKFTLKKLFKKTFLIPLKLNFSFLNSIAVYYFGKELNLETYTYLSKRLRNLYLLNKIRTLSQLIRTVKRYLKKRNFIQLYHTNQK